MNDNNLKLACQKIRRLEVLVSVLFVLLIGLIFYPWIIAKNTSDIIQANGFQLKNEVGQIMGGLEFQDSYPSLYLTDSDGNRRLVATHDNHGTQLFLKDQNGTTRVGIAQFSHGGGGFALHGENSKGAAVLYFKEQGSLRFFDTDGKVTNQLKAQEDK